MREYAESLFHEHAETGVLLDTNLLLLLVIGNARRTLVTSYKRLNMFVDDDFEALVAIVKRFTAVITTPNILTEVSNLAANLTGKHRDEYLVEFAKEIKLFNEQYVPSYQALSSPVFGAFGLSDAIISEIAVHNVLVVSIDAPLCQYLATMDLPVLNFNHIRMLYWT